MTSHLKGHRKLLWRTAIAATPLFALTACDFGSNAAYHSGFQLGYEQKTKEVERVTEILADDPPPTQGELLNAPMPAPVALAAVAPPKMKPAARSTRAATPTKVTAPSLKPAAKPAAPAPAPATPRAAPATQTAEAAPPPAAQAQPSAPPSRARAPFAPLRPGPGGGGVIIQVGNNPYPGAHPPSGGGNPGNPGGPKDPDTKPPTDKPGEDPGGGDTIPAPVPVVTAPQSNPAPVKITIVDTALTGKDQTSQMIGVGAISSKPATGQLASVNVLAGDTVASADVGKIASVSVLPNASTKPVDSIANISVGSTPIVSGGQAPLVSISALPDLSSVTNVVSPVTGAVVSTVGAVTGAVTGGASAPSAAAPAPTLVGSVVNTATGVVGGLTGALTGRN